MPETETIEALIVVRTYPTPSEKNVEVSCTAGVTRDGKWIRLFPIPYRFLDPDKRFQKYQWIKASVRKAADHRIESYTLDIESLKVVSDPLGTADAWRERKNVVFPLKEHCLCCLKKKRDEMQAPTLGIFRPRSIKRLRIEPIDGEWDDAELASLRQEQQQGGFFKTMVVQELEKIPFNFKYEFRCDESGCKGHKMKCTDWEMLESWRKWRVTYGDAGWETKFRQKYETEMIQKFDTHFCVGTLKAHPGEWNVVGLFYPPPTTRDLFGPN